MPLLSKTVNETEQSVNTQNGTSLLFFINVTVLPTLNLMNKNCHFIKKSFNEYNSPAMLDRLFSYIQENGKMVKIRIGLTLPRILTADVKFLECLLSSNKHIDKSSDYDGFKDWLCTGLLLSTGQKWHKRRKAITPTFHFNILEQFVDIFDTNGNVLVNKLKNATDSTTDLYPYITLYTLDVICESAMGIKMNAQIEDNKSDYVNAVKFMGKILITRTLSIFKQYDFFYQFTNDYRRERRAIKILHDVTESVIKERRKIINNKNGGITNTKKNEDDDGLGIKKRKAFLDMLLQCTIDGNKLSDLDIREEVDTFMFEGHDTTSSTISFCLLALSQNIEVQVNYNTGKKVYEEIESIFGDDKKRSVTYEDLQNMKYLELVIKETLRLYPAVPSYGRVLKSDLEFDGKIYPANSTIYIFVFGLHRDPTLYPNPEKFIPERFLDVKTDNNAYTYIPFSAGPRNCIGQKFAMLEIKAAVSKVLRHFKLLPVEGFKPIFLFESILKSYNGIQVVLEKR